jgi:putative membrane protein
VAHILRGFCIGTADLVPGVSGSTVAVLFGVYERLLASLRCLADAAGCVLRGDLRGAAPQLRRIDLPLVIPVAAGALVALATLARAIDWLLEHRAEPTAGAFVGLVIAAIVVAARRIRPWRWSGAALCVATAGVSGWVFGLSATPVADPAAAVWFGAGVLGVCAMILPGVSGAFALLIIGLYAPAIDALSDRDWAPLGLILGGAVVGALAFSTLLSRLLRRHPVTVMATMVGLMLGSLRVLWPWPNGVGLLGGSGEVISGTALAWPAGSEALWPVTCAVSAFAVALAVSRPAADPAAGTGRESGLLEAP